MRLGLGRVSAVRHPEEACRALQERAADWSEREPARQDEGRGRRGWRPWRLEKDGRTSEGQEGEAGAVAEGQPWPWKELESQ